CLLMGYGATAVNPYLALESIEAMIKDGSLAEAQDAESGHAHYIKAIGKGIKKVMSKMGISTMQSYRGAQIFECIGLAPGLVERYFTGTASRISGIDLDVIAEETRRRHVKAFPRQGEANRLDVGGQYHYRAQGERHLWSPRVIGALQRAVRLEDAKSYGEYANLINNQGDQLITLRGMWGFAESTPIPL